MILMMSTRAVKNKKTAHAGGPSVLSRFRTDYWTASTSPLFRVRMPLVSV